MTSSTSAFLHLIGFGTHLFFLTLLILHLLRIIS